MSEAHDAPVDRGSTGEDGLTIVELLMALVIVMIVFAGLAATMIASFSSIRNSEARVRAVALANELVEEMATAPWNQLGMEFAADPSDDADEFDGEFTVLLDDTANPVVPSPSVPSTLDRDGHTYQVERWVTWAEEDGLPEIKRMIAIVTWDVGGDGASIRSEGLRAPDAQDVFDLEVSVNAVANFSASEGTAMLLHPQGGPNEYRNTQRIDVIATLGVVESTVEMKFRDRNDTIHTMVATGGIPGESQRNWTLSPNERQFKHGRTSFTVFATGPDGQIASDTGALRFYQDLEVQTPQVYQDGAAVSEVTVDAAGQPCGDITIEVDVEGMTSGEATFDPDDPTRGGLRLRSPGGGLVIVDEMMGLVRTEVFGGRFIGEIDELILPDPLPLLPVNYEYTFEIHADRLDDLYGVFAQSHAPQFDLQIRVESVCP